MSLYLERIISILPLCQLSCDLSEFSPLVFFLGFSRLLLSYGTLSFIDSKVIHNVWRLGGENGQFGHNRASNA